MVDLQAAKSSGVRRVKMTTNQNKDPLTDNQILYRQYLRSPEWKRKRDAVFDREKGICQGCLNEPIEHVHHATYTHQYDELLFQLIGLCENCHRKVHFTVPSWNPWRPIA